MSDNKVVDFPIMNIPPLENILTGLDRDRTVLLMRKMIRPYLEQESNEHKMFVSLYIQKMAELLQPWELANFEAWSKLTYDSVEVAQRLDEREARKALKESDVNFWMNDVLEEWNSTFQDLRTFRTLLSMLNDSGIAEGFIEHRKIKFTILKASVSLPYVLAFMFFRAQMDNLELDYIMDPFIQDSVLSEMVSLYPELQETTYLHATN